MGFHVEINSILRSDDDFDLSKNAVNHFAKDGSRVFFDDIPIWLTRSDWTALAEIQVTTQTRTDAAMTGQFTVLHVYDAGEQKVMTDVFRRMYASGGDPHIYLLISDADYRAAVEKGTLYEDSLETQGFIHASPADQLTRVANKYYLDVEDVRVMVVTTAQVDAIVKWEPATGGLYPHIYGPLNMDAVDYVVPVSPGADGMYDITADDLDRSNAIDEVAGV